MTAASPADRPGGADPILTLPGRFRGAVFDLDGLLLDTEPGWRRAEAELLGRHGDAFTEADEAASLGAPVDVVVDRYATRLGLAAAGRDQLFDELMALARAEYARPLAVRPGATALLTGLHGRIPLAVASNTPRELVDRALEGSALSRFFDNVVTAGDVAKPKPAPDVYLEACQRLGVDPAEAVALEDSATGIAAARAAGLTVIAIPESPGVSTIGAHHVAPSLLELRLA